MRGKTWLLTRMQTLVLAHAWMGWVVCTVPVPLLLPAPLYAAACDRLRHIRTTGRAPEGKPNA